MKKNDITKLALCAVIAGWGGATLGCTANVHDNTADIHDNTANIDDAAVEFTTDVDNVKVSESVHVEVVAEDVFLIEPSADPPADRVKVAGHFVFYLDSTSSTPLLTTASKSVDVPIPATATPGNHTLICRVHKHDGTPTSVTFKLDIKISASVTTSGEAGSGATEGSGGSNAGS